MRALLSAIAWLSAGPHLLAAQPAEMKADAALIALCDAWIRAEVQKDRPELERVLDERFVATLPSGRTIDRSAFIEMIMKGHLEPFEVFYDALHVHGDAAVVINSSTDRRTKFTWIAVKQQGQWRVVSETFTAVRPPQ